MMHKKTHSNEAILSKDTLVGKYEETDGKRVLTIMGAKMKRLIAKPTDKVKTGTNKFINERFLLLEFMLLRDGKMHVLSAPTMMEGTLTSVETGPATMP